MHNLFSSQLAKFNEAQMCENEPRGRLEDDGQLTLLPG